MKRKVVNFALKETELSPRELAVTFTDQEQYFVSEPKVYRTLKAHDLITSPAFIVLKAANKFERKATPINQLWQTDFTYLKVLGWGWLYRWIYRRLSWRRLAARRGRAFRGSPWCLWQRVARTIGAAR